MDECIVLRFPKVIYSKSLLLRGIHDYAGICDMQFNVDGDAYCCTIVRSKAGLTLTAFEFANYLVELNNTRSSQL